MLSLTSDVPCILLNSTNILLGGVDGVSDQSRGNVDDISRRASPLGIVAPNDFLRGPWLKVLVLYDLCQTPSKIEGIRHARVEPLAAVH